MSQPQHLKALALANEIRMGCAAHRRDISALPRPDGMLLAADLLEALPDPLGCCRVPHFLQAIQRVGRRKALLLIDEAELPRSVESRRLSALTTRQRDALARALRQQAMRSAKREARRAAA